MSSAADEERRSFNARVGVELVRYDFQVVEVSNGVRFGPYTDLAGLREGRIFDFEELGAVQMYFEQRADRKALWRAVSPRQTLCHESQLSNP